MSGSDHLSKEIVATVKRVIDVSQPVVPLHEPNFCGREWEYVKECLDTGWVSSVGKFVDRFESVLREYTGAASAVATSNGTSALQMCCLLAGVERDDEVLVPALTFVATANAVAHCGAIPHFVDSELTTLGIDVPKLRAYLEKNAEVRGSACINRNTGRRIRALIAVHLYGHIGDPSALSELCREYSLEFIEDGAESLGSTYRGRQAGTFAKLASLSFNGNKIITTGGGGAILSQDPELGKKAKHITTTAKVPHAWEFFHDQVGYNYRLPNINAALGCAQMENLPGFLLNKRELAEKYFTAFSGISGVKVFREPANCRSNYWLNVMLLDDADKAKRDLILKSAHEAGLQMRPAWTLMHELPMYRDCPRMELNAAEGIQARLINLPSGTQLGLSR